MARRPFVVEDSDKLEIDEAGRLFFDGKAVKTQISFEQFLETATQKIVATIVAAVTVLSLLFSALNDGHQFFSAIHLIPNKETPEKSGGEKIIIERTCVQIALVLNKPQFSCSDKMIAHDEKGEKKGR